MIEKLGGKITLDNNTKENNCFNIIINSNLDQVTKREKKKISHKWILDSISHNKKLDVDNYYI